MLSKPLECELKQGLENGSIEQKPDFIGPMATLCLHFVVQNTHQDLPPVAGGVETLERDVQALPQLCPALHYQLPQIYQNPQGQELQKLVSAPEAKTNDYGPVQ